MKLTAKSKTLDLNPPQLEAVEHVTGPLLILAGAGSGKTRVLIARAANLVEQQLAQPWQILALTFTNKAAQELRNRATEIIGDQGASLAAGTFHSIFARLLRQEGRNIDLDPDYSIIDSDDRQKLIRSILKESGSLSDSIKPRFVEWQISRAKNSLVTPQKYTEQARDPIENTIARVYAIYERRLRMINGLDFDDLLIRPLEAFARFPSFLKRLQERFQYIMVDEYQDTNHAQYLLVKEIAKAHNNICVVGDDDQAIYGWRGATVKNILEFKKDWPDAKVINLEQNYRSTQPILDTAWAVIHYNKDRYPKKLWTNRKQGDLIDVVQALSDEDEALRFVSQIDILRHQHKLSLNQIAILYRTNAQSLPFERALRGAQIPYNVVGGLRFYERKEIKDLLAYLRVTLNPADDISLLRIINYPPRGIGDSIVTELQGRARASDVSIGESIDLVLRDSFMSNRQRNALGNFVTMMEHYRQFAREHPFHELASEVVSHINLKERLQKEERNDPSRAESKLANIEGFVSEITRFAESSPDATLHDFLQEVALVSDVDEYEKDVDRINLLTLHSSKGLEFPAVFIGGLEEGLLPLRSPDGSQTDVQEERRLFYVGVTRAKDHLCLGYALNRMRWGTQQSYGSSRFLKEIPHDLLKNPPVPPQRSAESREFFDKLKKSKTTRWNPSQEAASGGLSPDTVRVGLLVRHPKFGLGVVVKFQDLGQDSRLNVDFDEFGEKMLVLKFARLEAVK